MVTRIEKTAMYLNVRYYTYMLRGWFLVEHMGIITSQTMAHLHSLYSFSVLFFFPPSSFYSTALPCETVVRTLEELPCTSVHVLDVRVPCENSGQRIPLPGPMQRQHQCYSISSSRVLSTCFGCVGTQRWCGCMPRCACDRTGCANLRAIGPSIGFWEDSAMHWTRFYFCLFCRPFSYH